MIFDVLDLSNMTHAVFHTVVEKDFQVKMLRIFRSCCILYVLD